MHSKISFLFQRYIVAGLMVAMLSTTVLAKPSPSKSSPSKSPAKPMVAKSAPKSPSVKPGKSASGKTPKSTLLKSLKGQQNKMFSQRPVNPITGKPLPAQVKGQKLFGNRKAEGLVQQNRLMLRTPNAKLALDLSGRPHKPIGLPHLHVKNKIAGKQPARDTINKVFGAGKRSKDGTIEPNKNALRTFKRFLNKVEKDRQFQKRQFKREFNKKAGDKK